MSFLKSSSNADELRPRYILRGHQYQVSVLVFSSSCRYLFSGDAEGWIIMWDLSLFRPVLFWQAHTAGVLSIAEYDQGILSHGRDNQIHYYPLPILPKSITRAAASAVPSATDPTPMVKKWSMDVNALAYCKMAYLKLDERNALIAVPALTKDELIDIFHLPSLERVHRSIGADAFPIGDKTGTVMGISLLFAPPSSSSTSKLHLVAGYEDGRVVLFQFNGSHSQATTPPGRRIEEGEQWELVWQESGHREALMSLCISPDQRYAWSVAADHHLCKYRLFDDSTSTNETRIQQVETPSPGRSCVDIRSDGKLIGVAGWDGEARLYSAKSGQPLAVLSYHRSALHALAFSCLTPTPTLDDDEEDESDDDEMVAGLTSPKVRAWMATGGTESKITLWEVYPP